MMFGHKWSSSYGASDDGTWLAGLQGLTTEQIGKGLQRVLDDDTEWPPTLSQFRNMCKDQSSGLTHNTAAYKVFPKSRQLEKKPDQNKVMTEIARMRQLLQGK